MAARRDVVSGGEEPAEMWSDTEQIEEIARDELAGHDFGRAVDLDDRWSHPGAARDGGKRRRSGVLELTAERVGKTAAEVVTRVRPAEQDERRGVVNRQ